MPTIQGWGVRKNTIQTVLIANSVTTFKSRIVALQGLPLQIHTNAVPGTSGEGHISVWVPSLTIFREESLRPELLWVREDLRISMQGIS